MILLQIKNIKQVKPVKWESKNLTGLKEGQGFIRFAGDHPNNPEYGSIVLSTRILNGQFDDIKDILFIGDNAQEGILLNYKKQVLGGYKTEIAFDTIFGHGLKYCASNFIQSGGALIGLTETEKKSLSSIETQRKLLFLLAEFILPNKKELVLDFAKESFLCIPNDENDSTISHFLGKPKHDNSEIKDGLGNELFHLATLHPSEFDKNLEWMNAMEPISFYLKINDTENGWPEVKNDFRVMTGSSNSNSHNSKDVNQAVNFRIIPFLDLPGYDHVLLYHHKLTETERDNFDSLRSVFLRLTIGDKAEGAVNKFLGYPDSVQNCVSYEAERIFNKREYSEEIVKDAINWCLLLQVDPYCKWFQFFDEFGDGAIYYMIRKEDLEKGDFSNCQIVVQNT